MALGKIHELRKKLDELLSRFKRGERKGLVLTMLALIRLEDKGDRITPENVAREARRIIDENPDVEWGVSKEEYTVGLASALLRELVEMGVIEESETGVYRLARHQDGDPRAEILARFGYLIFYGGPAR